MATNKFTIHEIVETIIRDKPALTFPLQIYGGRITDQNGHHIMDMRGWGYLQYADNDMGADLQDSIGQWVVDTLNKEYSLSLQKHA